MENCSIRAAERIRELSLKLVHKANASHIGSALSIADLMGVLTTCSNICDMKGPKDPGRDRLFLSKGHACVAMYSALCVRGYVQEADLMTYGQDFSPFMNHASHYVPGIEFSTGALGHALPVACGASLAAKMKGHKWHIYVILSDGELQEGSNWEALMFAAHHKLKNITIIIDYNNLQSLDTVDNTLSLEPLEEKLRAFNWSTQNIDGHDHRSLKQALYAAKNSDKPEAVIMRTIKGKGVSFMENSIEWHYKSPNDRELEQALREVNGQ